MIILYWFLVAIMMAGIVGAVIPGIPGISLILGAVVIWAVVKGFSAVSIALAVALIVFLFSIGIDFLAGYWGAKKAGASNWGQVGAFVGMLLGFFGLLPALPFGGPLLGLLLGPLLGATVGEFIHCKDIKIAVKAGLGIVVGSVVGNLIQGVLAIVTVSVFILTTFPPAA